MKQILITEEQLDKVLREEFCKFAAEETDESIEGFMEGIKLTLKLASVSENVLDRLFRSTEGVNKSEI